MSYLRKNCQEVGLKEAGFLSNNSQVTEVGALDFCSQDTEVGALDLCSQVTEVGALDLYSQNAYCQVTEVGALDLYSQDTYNDCWEAGFLLNNSRDNDCWEAGFLLNNSQKDTYCWEAGFLLKNGQKDTYCWEAGFLLNNGQKDTYCWEAGFLLNNSQVTPGTEVGALVVTSHDTVKLAKLAMNIDIEVDALNNANHDSVKKTKHKMNIGLDVGTLNDTSHGAVKVPKDYMKKTKYIVQKIYKEIFNFIFKNTVKDRVHILLSLGNTDTKSRAGYRKQVYCQRCTLMIKVNTDRTCLLYKMLILLLGGDIETNPGPRQKKASYDKRKRKERDRKRKEREKETSEAKQERLEAQKCRSSANRNSETLEQTAKRIKEQKHRTTVNRESEPLEKTAKRIQEQKHRTAVNRESEPLEKRAKRIQGNKHRTAANRKSEPLEKTAKRIQEQKHRTAVNRESETQEKANKRRKQDRDFKAKIRALETPEQTFHRRKVEKDRIYQSRANSDLKEITELFKEKIKSGPDFFVCICCHRMMYRQNVRPYHKGKFPKLSKEQHAVILEPFMYTSTDGRTWICITCDRALQKGNMPRQAKANGLSLFDIPPELSRLNEVEIRLLSRRIPFMKIVALPKGKQRAIHGPAVNVPTQLDTICNLLPRLPNECEIIPMKLKRRLCYKSHYMYDSVHPQNIIDALKWLIQNNKHYSDVKLNNNWADKWNDDDPELWQALTGSKSELQVSDENEKGVPLDTPNAITMIKSNTPVIPDSFSHLVELCTAEGYSVENVQGDGNCFYHAVEKQLKHSHIHLGDQSDYLKLRANLCNYLEANPNGPNGNLPYKHFLANRVVRGDSERETAKDQYIEQMQDEADREELRWQRYLQDMEEGSWADHIAVQGMADMLHVAIRVIATLNPNTPLIKPRDGLVNGMLHLGLIGQSHYVSLIRTTDTLQIETIETFCSSPEQNHKSPIRIDHNATDDKETHGNNKGTESSIIDEEEFEYQQDSKAFEISSKLRGLPLDTCLQLESIDANKIISVAPGEGAKPLNILTDELFEEMSFPHKYPNGKGGFSQERKEKITVRKFFNQRLLDVDGRFAKDVEYLLAAQYAVEHDQVDNLQSIVIRQMKGRQFQGQKITAGDLKNTEKLNQLVQKDYAYRILKDVRGTPAYWQKVHHEVLAMIRQLGIPTWFLTLSAADMKWPEVIQIIARQYGTILTDEQVSNLSWEEKCNWLRRNPVTAARHFQYRLDLFWNEFIKSKSMPIGEVVDFMIRIEFQARGSPHAHTIVWIKDAPKFGTDPVENVVQFIDKYQTCAIPDNDPELHDLVQLQSHVHSFSCMRKGSCRFDIPKFPSPTTLISSEPQEEQGKAIKLKHAKDIFKRINDIIIEMDSFENVTLQHLLQVSNVSMKDYMEALNTSKRGNTVVLKRQPTEMNINNYNPSILKAWKANMDIQYILDAYACVMYVTSYMMKSERAMGELLRHVSKECSGEDIRTQLRKLGTTFLNHREVSAQEASFRILSIPLKKLSRKCVFINTNPQNERVTMTKPLASIQALENDDEDLYLINLIDRYAARPDQLENICLAEFAANYDIKYSQTVDEENDHTPNPLQQEKVRQTRTINLKNGLGKMQKRSREAIIRFPKHNIEKDSEKYYRAKLMLYYPWRQENNIKGESPSYCDQYRHCLEDVTENVQRYTQNGPSFEEAMQDLNEFGPPIHAFANIAPGVEQQNIEDRQEGIVEERHLEQQDLDENAELVMAKCDQGIGQRFDTQTDTSLMSSAEYCKKMQKLNKEQRNIVQYHRKWCKSVIQAARHNKPAPKAYKVFISGPGGVGKSHVIDLLKNDTYRLLRHLPSVHPHDILSLICAPTGTAAFNISGMTIHSTFLIPIAMKQYRNIGVDTLNTLRNKLNNLKVIIIDEISMVGSHLLYHIHRRLEEIKGSDGQGSTFGDITMIAVGDLYQLPPVGKAYVFDHPADSYAKLQDPLWYQFQLAELTQIMRQKDDAMFAQLLNRVRTASCSKDDIALLKSREISPDMDNYPMDILHVYSTHKLVDEHNQKMLSKIHETVHTIKAIDSKKDKNSGIDIKFPDKVSETGGLETSLKIAVGCRVMLTYNLDVTDGLANGATGTVSHIAILADTVVNILVVFDDPRIGVKAKRLSQYRQNYPNSVPVSRHEAVFNIGIRKCISASRRQFPLRLSWASTIHKVQGLTTDCIVVSFEGRFFPGQAYVALSRVRCLNGLHILKFDPAQIHVDCAVVREMERLDKNRIVENTEAANPEDFNLQVSHLNIRGIKSHKDDLKLDQLVKQSNVLCFCETFLKDEDNFNPYSFGRDDMQIFRIDRPNSNDSINQPGSGGVLLAVQQNNKPILTARQITRHLEYIAVQVHYNNQALLIISLYRPPGSSINMFLQEMEEILKHINPKNYACMIVGDFNEDICQEQSKIANYFISKGFQQKTDMPTRDGGSLLDHTYVSSEVNVISVTVQDTYYSDHDFVSVKIT